MCDPSASVKVDTYLSGCDTDGDAELVGTTAALLALCCDGPPAGSKAAPRSLVALAGREEAAEQLKPIAKQLASRLVRTGGGTEAKISVTMAALSSIGRCLPEVRPYFPPFLVVHVQHTL